MDKLLDVEVVKELIGVTAQDIAFIAELLRDYAADARQALERMDGYARQGDCAALAREAHRLKGSSGTVGALQLARECLAIEHAARGGTSRGLESTIVHASAVLEATRGRMIEFFRGTMAAST
jgi:HPt (histidine-containing phosphotransfer) domain-containing protein